MKKKSERKDQPLTFLFASKTKVEIKGEQSADSAMEIDTKEPYADCSDTI